MIEAQRHKAGEELQIADNRSHLNTIEVINKNKKELAEISQKYLLSLNTEEMVVIQNYFKKEKRNPTDVELETIAQTWSEHCKHKTITSTVQYKFKNKQGQWKIKRFNNLLKETVFKVTKELNKKWCLSVFKDNAGIIEFDKTKGVAFKVETHNHPSALEPYGGAGTGIGGVIRDVLGVGLAAKPIMNTDVFCFGPVDYPYNKIPEGVLHPKRIVNGVVSGVRDYGNRMGIPTANGSILFDESYIYNPLVFCGTVGMIPKSKIMKRIIPGDLILAVGGRTGRDGIHGATFSSLSLDKDTQTSVVQIGNPIVEKKILDTILQARDKNLFRAITDCGAGGFSSAIGELAIFSGGAKVYLEKAPLKYKGLMPWEIWVSESQERMVLTVPPKKIEAILKVFHDEDVEATVLGEFTDSNQLEIYYENKLVGLLDMEFLHEGLPKSEKKAIEKQKYKSQTLTPFCIKNNSTLENTLKQKLSDLNTSSKEWVIRQYDFEVQGQTIIKPFVGMSNEGPSDAAVIKPDPRSNQGIVVSNGINLYGKADEYHMAASSIDEALRNIVCVGGDLNRTAILDNFCWGTLDTAEEFGGLVKACLACYDIAKVFQTPFISGKDSLNNKYVLENDKVVSITPTLLISAISVIEDVRRCITMDLKQVDDPIYLIGLTQDEFPPTVEPRTARRQMLALQKAIQRQYIIACHDCSEGGLGVAISEMCFSSGLGVEMDLNKVLYKGSGKNKCDAILLFSETNSRFIVEVKADYEKEFIRMMKGNKFSRIGKVIKEPKLIIYGKSDSQININELKDVWQNALAEKL